MSERAFASYRYCAFISYASDDDAAWNSFVSCFTDELNLALGSRLHMTLPPAHLSGDDPLTKGSITDELRKNIEDSFVMFIFVHDSYLLSGYCRQELEHFASLYGEAGFRERLYLISMSDSATQKLLASDDWKRLCPIKDLVWQKFFREDKHDRPIEIYASNARNKRAVVAEAFWNRFVDVREDLADRIRAVLAKEQVASAYPLAAAVREVALPEDQALVRVYIENNTEQNKYWDSMSQQLVASWDRVASALKTEPRLYLRPTGLPMNEIDKRPMLDDADGVVLLWGAKTPDSLAAQIKKVEPKLSGPNYAPGVIAYLMEGPDDLPVASSVTNWNVVRFLAHPDGTASVLQEDAPALEVFVSNVLVRKRWRLTQREP
jgi:hypothetical protein